MPANELNLIIDANDGSLYKDFSGRGKTTLNKLTDWSSGNTYAANLFLVEKDGSGILQSVPGNTDSIFRIGRASRDLGGGSVTFTFTESVTIDSDELTAKKLEKALNSLDSMKAAGKVDVEGEKGNFNITFRTVGDKATLTATSDVLPTSSVTIDVAVAGTASVREKLVVRFIEDAAVVADTWTNIAESAATVTVQQDDASLRHIEIIELTNFPSGGSFTYSHTTTTGDPISINSTAAEFEALLTGKSVEKIGKYKWRVTWDAVGTATTGTTDSTAVEEFAGVESNIALNSTQLYSILRGRHVDMIAEIVDLDGESYHRSEIRVNTSVGDEGPGLPSTASTGDMTAATYDPTMVAADVFDMDNMVEGANTKILTSSERTAIAANTAKVTNATHTGEVTGSGTLTVDSSAVTGKTATTATGSDYVLISDTSDAGNLKKALISDFASAGGDMAAATYDPNTVAGDAFDMDNMVEGSTNLILTAAERTAIGNVADPSYTTVANYAAMRASTDMVDAHLLTGVGGGWFWYNSAGTATDDSGRYITRTDGRRYERHVSGPLNVRWFGAVGDGVTDDTAAFQAALDTGHSIWIPNGTYAITAELTCNTSGQRVIGESMNSVIINLSTDSRGFVLQQTGNAHWPVATGTSPGSQQSGCLMNLRIRNTSGSSTKTGFDIEPNVLNSNYTVEGYIVENVQIEAFATGYEIRYSSKVQFRNTNAKACTTRGYYIYGTTNNCPRFEHLSVNDCPIGVTIDAMNGGIVTLGDFALTTTVGVEVTSGQVILMGGELESFDPGGFFDITNATVTIIGCKFLSGYSRPITVNASAYVNVFGCVWAPTDTGHASYDPALIELTSTNCMAFGYCGGLWGTGDLGASNFAVRNAIKKSDGTYAQLNPAVAHQARRDTHATYTIDDTWLGILTQENHVDGSLGGHGGGMVTWGINGDGVYYRNDLSSPMLKGTSLSSSTLLTEGWENFISKAGGQLTVRDPVNAYNQAKLESPKVMFIYNDSASDMTIARHLANTATATINGVQADETLGPYESCWMITDGVDNWIMLKSGKVTASDITGKAAVTAVGSDYVLLSDTSDAGNLKKALVSDFASAGGDMAAATYDPNTVAGDAFDMDNMVEGANTKILTSSERTAIAANTAKVTNATHTGEVTGSGTLTIDSSAVTGKTAATATGSDYVLISDTSDSGNLKKALVSDFASSGGDMAAATYDPASVSEQLVGLTATQTLTNKTLTTPTITTIHDSNGNESVTMPAAASAVNYIKLQNSAAASEAQITPEGETNVDLGIGGKGTGTININSDINGNSYAMDDIVLTQADIKSSGNVVPVELGFALSDETTALTTGQKLAVDMPFSMVITRVYASLTTAATGSAVTVDVEDEGASLLNAVLSISTTANNAETSTFASAASSYTLTKGDLLTIDIDQKDSSDVAAGLKVFLIGHRTI